MRLRLLAALLLSALALGGASRGHAQDPGDGRADPQPRAEVRGRRLHAGLQYNPDGSLSIYMSPARPPDAPSANWLPVSPGRFNVALRIYGTEAGVETYVPPGIQSR